MEGYVCDPNTGDGECAFPLRCNGAHCVRGSGVGQPCNYGFSGVEPQPCKIDLACQNGTRADGGSCAALFPLDAGCLSAFECAGTAVCPGVGFAQLPDGGFQFTAGACTAPRLGAPCASSIDCDTGTAYCQPDAGCVARRARGSMA